jgi:uncharacterized membrane protein
MSFIVWAFVGLLLGVAVEQTAFGAVAGAVLGLWWARMSILRRDLDATRRELAEWRAREPGAVVQPVAPPVVPDFTQQPPQMVDPPPRPVAAPVAAPVAVSAPTPPPARPEPPTPPRAPAGPSGIEILFGRIKGWFFEGNVPVKIGMLVLFAGVAAALKYAADAGMLHVSPSVRVGVIALAAIAALVFGWRKRNSHRIFALSLQGGAIGVLVMTVFAAFRLYLLIPPMPAFALLVVLIVGIGMLAVLQDALALAVLGLIAGFAAPILIDTGSGNYVGLFSYYAVLNLAILGIAWKKSWRVLNLLGFFFTFGIGTAWGVLSYKTEFFASTEPFLILNFLFYLVIPLLHLLRAPDGKRTVMDGCLLFGNPLVSLLLQGALLDWKGTPLAISALAAAVIYLVVAFAIRKRPGMHLLRDAWAVLAVAFATLAIPLALSASLTASAFALEGAGMIWLGLRQRRRLPRWSGVALQVFAGIALGMSVSRIDGYLDIPILNSDFVSALLVVIGGFVACWLYGRYGSGSPKQRVVAVLLFLWAMAWWFAASISEIERFVPYMTRIPVVFATLAVTTWLVAECARRRPRFEMASLTAFTVPVFLFLGAVLIVGYASLERQLLSGWMLGAIVVGAVAGWRSLACLKAYAVPASFAQFVWLWRWVLTFTGAIVVAFLHARWLSEAWLMLLGALPFLALWLLFYVRPRWVAAPLAEHWSMLRVPLLYSLTGIGVLLFLCDLFAEGGAEPLRFIPLINPIELLMLAMALGAVRWFADPAAIPGSQRLRPLALGIAGMAFATSATLRAVHHLGGVPWTDAMASSSLAQMSLTVVWSVLGVVAWVVGSRRGLRMLWLAGAVTMGIVLAKLLLVDRGHLGNLFGIGSFIAYGLLCTAIGYFAPAPPRSPSSSGEIADAS